MSYTHFTIKQRIKLEGYLEDGLSKAEIAKRLGFNRSSINREIERGLEAHRQEYPNQEPKYIAELANDLAFEKRYAANQSRIILNQPENAYLVKIIERCMIKKKWSPEQIAGRLSIGKIMVKGVYPKIKIAVQTIYDWIYQFRKDLKKHLRHIHGYRHSRQYYLNKKKRKLKQKQKSIERRPKHIEKRNRIGHWEGDTVLGSKNGATGRIGTLAERKTGYFLAFKIDALTKTEKLLDIIDLEVQRKTTSFKFADGCTRVFQESIKPKYTKTLTLDNGSENANYEWIERDNNLDVYFAHPYRSWERGTNENTNGLLRQFFPKGISFTNLTQKEIDKAVKLINNRPRKRLGWLTPKEVMQRAGALK